MARKRTQTEEVPLAEPVNDPVSPPAENKSFTAAEQERRGQAGPNEKPASFVDAVGKKEYQKTPDPYEFVTDPTAGIRVFQSDRDKQMAIKFGDGKPEDKPSEAVLDVLRDRGFKWKSKDKIWALEYKFSTPMTARIEAERVYQEVAKMIRAERGLGEGVPF